MSTPNRPRSLDVEVLGDATIVSFRDKKILVEESIQVIGEHLLHLADEPAGKKLLLNFSNVEYMSSAMLGMLVTLNKKVQAAKGKLVLCSIAPQIREAFTITKLEKLLVIRANEQEALQAF